MDTKNELFDWNKYRQFVSSIVPDCKMKFLADTPDMVLGKSVRRDVVHFIANFMYNTGANPEDIFILFKGGYCYYFAKILETAFGGTIVWEPDAGHILWMDENQILYDIEGVRDDIILKDIRSLDDLEAEAKRLNTGGIQAYMHIDDLDPV